MTPLRDVGALEEFPERQMRILDVAGREVGVVRLQDRVYALRNMCPHQVGPLCRGMVLDRVVAAGAGVLEIDRATPVVTCPWHGWEFDLETGRCLTDARKQAVTYSAEVRDGRVLVATVAGP